ncbi:MAG: NAD-dependent epimerase/dehydratase family protein [Chloroflexi bacterium]|nr:NAD-dependent epimerase/dehydratase family protein [Chloroflexota bacterium]
MGADLAGRRCLVTGVAGFIGSHLAERLLAEGYDVLGVDCLRDYYPRSFKERNLAGLLGHPRFAFREADLARDDLTPILGGANLVFHQAAQPGVRASWGREFDTYLNDNIRATQRLLEAAKTARLDKIVYASSSSVYGETAGLAVKETDPTAPHSPYGVSKLAAEHLCRLYQANFGLPTVCLRYFTAYGPRQRPDQAFHRFIYAILQGQAIHVYGDGEQSRDFTYVADVVEANLLAARHGKPGAVYNVGGGSAATVNEVLRLLAEGCGRPPEVIYEGTQNGDVRHTRADCSLAQAELGFRPRYSLATGLAAEAAWLREELP